MSDTYSQVPKLQTSEQQSRSVRQLCPDATQQLDLPLDHQRAGGGNPDSDLACHGLAPRDGRTAQAVQQVRPVLTWDTASAPTGISP